MKSRLLALTILSLGLMFAAGTALAGGFSNYLGGEAGIVAPQEREAGAVYNFGPRGLPDSQVVLKGEAGIIGPNDTPSENSVLLEVEAPFSGYWGEAGATGPVDHMRVNP